MGELTFNYVRSGRDVVFLGFNPVQTLDVTSANYGLTSTNSEGGQYKLWTCPLQTLDAISFLWAQALPGPCPVQTCGHACTNLGHAGTNLGHVGTNPGRDLVSLGAGAARAAAADRRARGPLLLPVRRLGTLSRQKLTDLYQKKDVCLQKLTNLYQKCGMST